MFPYVPHKVHFLMILDHFYLPIKYLCIHDPHYDTEDQHIAFPLVFESGILRF